MDNINETPPTNQNPMQVGTKEPEIAEANLGEQCDVLSISGNLVGPKIDAGKADTQIASESRNS